MNKNLEQIQLFNFPGYSMNNKCYPSAVCPGCRKNLYRLKKGDSPCVEYGVNVAKVFLMIFTLYFHHSYLITFTYKCNFN